MIRWLPPVPPQPPSTRTDPTWVEATVVAIFAGFVAGIVLKGLFS